MQKIQEHTQKQNTTESSISASIEPAQQAPNVDAVLKQAAETLGKPKDPVLALLIAGRALLSDKERWTRGALARYGDSSISPLKLTNAPSCSQTVYVGSYGEIAAACHKTVLNPDFYTAPSYCSLGALVREGFPDEDSFYNQKTIEVYKEAKHCLELAAGNEVPNVNDNMRYSHADILNMWDKAIAMRRASTA